MNTYTVDSLSGTKYWFLDRLLHREDGPAIEHANGTKFWYQNDNLHREDGPACEFADGMKFWHIDGKQITEKEFLVWNVRRVANLGMVDV